MENEMVLAAIVMCQVMIGGTPIKPVYKSYPCLQTKQVCGSTYAGRGTKVKCWYELKKDENE